MKKNPSTIAFITIEFILLAGTLSQHVSASQSKEEQANEATIQLAQDTCLKINERRTACELHGDQEQCDTLNNESLPWFQNRFRALPEVICPLAARGQLFMSRS